MTLDTMDVAMLTVVLVDADFETHQEPLFDEATSLVGRVRAEGQEFLAPDVRPRVMMTTARPSPSDMDTVREDLRDLARAPRDAAPMTTIVVDVKTNVGRSHCIATEGVDRPIRASLALDGGPARLCSFRGNMISYATALGEGN